MQVKNRSKLQKFEKLTKGWECDSHDVLLHHQPSAVHLSDSISGYHQCVVKTLRLRVAP